jgi:hypothetical protein
MRTYPIPSPSDSGLKYKPTSPRYWWNRPQSGLSVLLDRIRTLLTDRSALYLGELSQLLGIPSQSLSSALGVFVRSGFLARQRVSPPPPETGIPHNSLWLYCLPQTLPPCQVKEPETMVTMNPWLAKNRSQSPSSLAAVKAPSTKDSYGQGHLDKAETNVEHSAMVVGVDPR